MNQGMLMESMNLAVAWALPVLFICKDSQWAITTISANVTGGRLVDRAASFGMPSTRIDGTDVNAVWKAAAKALKRARKGKGPSFIQATCTHPEGHFLGDPLVRIARHPMQEMRKIAGPILKSATRVQGSSVIKRSGGLASVSRAIVKTAQGRYYPAPDPLTKLRRKLKREYDRLDRLETEIKKANQAIVDRALATP